jgi:DNA-directed RNA polymerase specialized sigma24 family protein
LAGLAWLAVPRNAERIHSTAYNLCYKRGRLDLLDDVYDAATDKADQAYATWCEDGGASIDTHMIVALRWYMRKKMDQLCAPKREIQTDAQILADHVSYLSTPIDEESEITVNKLCGSLDPLDALLLWMRHGEPSMSYEAIGKPFNRSKNTIRWWIEDAEEKARKILES